MRSRIQCTPAYELSAEISRTDYGHNFKLISFVPTARRPNDHVQFQALLSQAELKAFRDLINQALDAESQNVVGHGDGGPCRSSVEIIAQGTNQ